MAIVNTLLGGTDLVASAYLHSSDLNDTFNAAANVVKGVTTFWLNTYTRTLFDDFSSYTTDANVPSTKWTWTHSGSGTHTETWKTRASTNAGGTSKEGELYAYYGGEPSSSVSWVKTVGLTANKHKYFKIYYTLGVTSYNSQAAGAIYISFDKDSTSTNFASASAISSYSRDAIVDVKVIAKGSNQYDCYIAGKLVQTVTDVSFEVRLHCNASGGASSAFTGGCTLYVTDVYESSGSV